jgi:deoxyadenosine/deoxycytidine kinase
MQTPATEARLIAIEGVIGAGKTSLARLLSRALGARLHLEVVDENPFLPRFYAEPKRYAFPTQIFFLLSRYQQQQEFFQQDLFSQRVVSDYLFAKDRIFANLNLADDELRLYERLAAELETRVPVPDRVVYLQASLETLLARIARRGRTYERDMPRRYLEDLSDAYNHYFFHYRDAPLLVVNTNEIDFVHDPRHFEDLRRRIEAPWTGVQYYTPAAERGR